MNKSIDDLGVINIAPLQTFQEFMPKSIPNSIFLNECSTFEVTQIINELETGKSSDIPIKVIKRANLILSPILALHFNYLMKIGKFPDTLKLRKISPFTRKRTQNNLKIIDLFLHSQSLVKYLKNLFIKDFITFL